MELHHAGETVVVPVVLENCRWKQTALGALNALPEKGKALNTWNPQSNGWNTVSDGLAQVFTKTMENHQTTKLRSAGSTERLAKLALAAFVKNRR